MRDPISATCRLGIFAKYWQPGHVKTRLARTIGPEAAARLYRVFVETLLRRFGRLPVSRVVAIEPFERQLEFSTLGKANWQIEPQSSGDLGQRMAAFFHRAFESSAQRVVLIGSDCPTLRVEYVEQAFDLLATHPVVLGPSDDGGYYLVGAAGGVPAIFENVAWSTPRVWEQTLHWLSAAQLRVAELPPWYDVDDVQDLRRLAEELTGDRGTDGPADNSSTGDFHELAAVVREVLENQC